MQRYGSVNSFDRFLKLTLAKGEKMLLREAEIQIWGVLVCYMGFSNKDFHHMVTLRHFNFII